jgi:hypothetical protein
MTASELISASLRLIGVPSIVTPGAQALEALNNLLQSWTTERLSVYAIRRNTHVLTATTQTYTIGTGGVINVPRPAYLESASILLTGVRYPLELIDSLEWDKIREDAVSALLPLKLYNDYASPLSTLYLWPKPSGTPTLELQSWQPLATFATLADVVALPPGYERAVRYNLAIDLAPEFNRQISQEVLGIATQSKAEIAELNALNAAKGPNQPENMPPVRQAPPPKERA